MCAYLFLPQTNCIFAILQSTEEYIVYENTIRVDNNLTKGMIQRQHDKAISFRCRYNRKNKLNNVEFSGSNTYVNDINEHSNLKWHF